MTMLRVLAFLLVLVLTSRGRAAQVFAQLPDPAGGQYKSAWYPPDGLDGDEYAFDNFTLASSTAINEVRWRGAYTNYLQGAGRAPVFDFTISIYRSIAGGSQPDLGAGGRLARYFVGGNASETPIGTFGGVIMYDYAFVLTAPFQAVAGTRYWVQIEASQGLTPLYYWPPDWSMARGMGGNNSHFRRITGGPYQTITGDLAFSLYSSDAPTVTITAGATPAEAGTITGAGAYPIGSTVTLQAAPNAGWGFVNWTENGSPVSGNDRYTFTATTGRTLAANFAHAFSITTSAYPTYGGTIMGGGMYNEGDTVALVAEPHHGFVFVGWSDGATTPTHSFPAVTDLQLTAFFDSAPLSETFNFDNAPAYTTLPIDLSVDGLSAHLTSDSPSGGTFVVWPYDTWGISPDGFEGLSLFPTTVFGADLIVDFSESLVDFSILYSPQELGCDDSATMRATAYMGGVFVGTATATVPVPGTYPSGTLSISVPGGFDRVVVHYDSRPPTCQDWGPIFFADNVTVTRLCIPPTITDQPGSMTACATAEASFVAAANGAALMYQWQVEAPFGSNTYFDLSDGPVDGVGFVSGSGVPVLTIGALEAGAVIGVRVVVAGPCGAAISERATLTVQSCCSADYNADGIVTSQDFFDFLSGFFANNADLNRDGVTNSQDFFDFLAAFFAGC